MKGWFGGACVWLSALSVGCIAASDVRAVDFDTQIIPLLTKSGCNAGACHGAAAGRGGFRLSLLGGNPAADYESIVQELKGRRVNLAHPSESLVLAKPTGTLPHEGGIRLPDGSGAERLLLEWIAAGATRSKTPRRLTSFGVDPIPATINLNQAKSLRARARFDGGEPIDVTAWTVFTAADPASVEIAGESAMVRRRGQHAIVVRFLDRVVPLQLVVPFSDQPIEKKPRQTANVIDEEVNRKLDLLRLPSAASANAAAFLRRVRLDLTGTLPTPDEVESYLADRSPNKRSLVVDRLLSSDDFVDFWAYRLATIFRNRASPNDDRGVQAFHQWLRDCLRTREPIDRMARALILATGDSHAVGPVNFVRTSGDARSHAELVSQVFLGARMQCANCHNHPLDRWTQDDYHGLAAIFAKLDRGRIVRVADRGAVTNPRTGEPAQPRIPGDRYLNDADNAREILADWITNPSNRSFPRAIVNRLWSTLFGRGLIEPVDDMRETNPGTHPELLDRLADDFVQNRYDLRHTLRLMALSEAYSRSDTSSPANQSDDQFYSHAQSRPLVPEVLADAIASVTGVPDQYGNLPSGTRAIALANPAAPARSLDILGRCTRAVSCEGTTDSGGLPAKLHLLNGDVINRKIAAPEGRLHRLIDAGKPDGEIVNEFYLRALGRSPNQEERAVWTAKLSRARGQDRTATLEDFLWSLLNCREFQTNH